MDNQPTLEQMALIVLRAIHEKIYSRESEVLVDEAMPARGDQTFEEWMGLMQRGIIWHDGEDPIIAFSGDSGLGTVTIHQGTTREPFRDHAHAGDFGPFENEEAAVAAFVRGLYRHFHEPEGVQWGIPMSEVEVNDDVRKGDVK